MGNNGISGFNPAAFFQNLHIPNGAQKSDVGGKRDLPTGAATPLDAIKKRVGISPQDAPFALSNAQTTVEAAGNLVSDNKRGALLVRVRNVFGKIAGNVKRVFQRKHAEQTSSVKIVKLSPDKTAKITSVINKIPIHKISNADASRDSGRSMATATGHFEDVVATPHDSIDKFFPRRGGEIQKGLDTGDSGSWSDLKSMMVLDTIDMRHLLSVGEVHGIKNKAEGEHLLSALNVIGKIFKEYVGSEKLDEGSMLVLQGLLGKLEAGAELAKVIGKKYTTGVDDTELKDAANRLIVNINETPAIFQVGCKEHCVGLEVERGDDGKVHVRISNVGDGCDLLLNPIAVQNGDEVIAAYVPTYEFTCEDEGVAKNLIFNLMKVFNEDKEANEMYECFNKTGINFVNPQEDKMYYRPGQIIGNCVFRNVFEAAYNCLHRNNIDPNRFQEFVFAYAKEAVKQGDVYPELQNAAERISPPLFLKQSGEII